MSNYFCSMCNGNQGLKGYTPAKQEKQESLFGITTKAAAHALKETTSEITSEEAHLLKYIKLFTN